MNKKGMTLVELLITIVLVSIVLIFLFKLLSDLRNERDNNDYVVSNEINRADAIYIIERDFQRFPLVRIDFDPNNQEEYKFNFKVKGSTKTAILSTYKENDIYYIKYINAEGETYVWEMKDARLASFAEYTFYNGVDRYYFKLHIDVYSKNNDKKNNEFNNSLLDDIEISGYGKKEDNIVPDN